jgi:hypothetical protein
MKKEELIKEMETSIQKLIRETEKLSREVFETQPITGAWTAKEILSHVAAWDLIFVDLSTKILKGEPLPERPDFDIINAEQVSKRRNLDRTKIIGEVNKNRKIYTDFVAALTEKQLYEPNEQNITIEDLARNIISHDRHHLQQIKPL